jgi:hypothetical protein
MPDVSDSEAAVRRLVDFVSRLFLSERVNLQVTGARVA